MLDLGPNVCLRDQILECLSINPQMHHYRNENGKLACTKSVFEDILTACFYHIMKQRIPNFAYADRKKLVANTATTKRIVELFYL